MAAKELGLTPTTEGGSNFTMNLTLMQDGYAGLEHSLPISPFFQDVVKLGAASGITYTPTFIVSYGGPIGLHVGLRRLPAVRVVPLAASSETEPAMITSSPCFQLTGVATLCLAVSSSESTTRSTSSKLRPVVIG